MGLGKENLIFFAAIVGDSSILTAPQGKLQGKELFVIQRFLKIWMY